MTSIIFIAAGTAFLCRVLPFLLVRISAERMSFGWLAARLNLASQAMLGMLTVQLAFGLEAFSHPVDAQLILGMTVLATAFVAVARGFGSNTVWFVGVAVFLVGQAAILRL